MNGGHDLGGMHGLGPIDPEPENEEPVFHAEWEKRVFALTLASGFVGKWNIDASRHARERQHPADYIRNTYFENWLQGLETLLIDSGLVTANEIAAGKASGGKNQPQELRVLKADQVEKTLTKGGPSIMAVDHGPAFKVGDNVRVRNINPTGHTRAPRYTRGRVGVVAIHHGAHIFPDKNAHGTKEGQHLYSVRFEARELWGADTTSRDAVHVDLWDEHLEAAG